MAMDDVITYRTGYASDPTGHIDDVRAHKSTGIIYSTHDVMYVRYQQFVDVHA